MRSIAIIFSLALLVACGEGDNNKILETGPEKWDLFIQSDNGDKIPARIAFEEIDGEQYLNIINAEDVIQLKPWKTTEDTTFYKFVDYNAEIAFANDDKNKKSGYWINYESTVSAKRDIFAEREKENSDKTDKMNYNFEGKWEAKVQSGNHSYPALILIDQENNKLTGTIRTNSGDYSFLEGEVDGDKLLMTAFSGRSIFKLSAYVENDSLIGKMTSESKNETGISGVKNANFDLPKSTSLTKTVNDKPFELDLPDENGEMQNFENLVDGKVSIVSIFGTWCPNCVDETDYLKDLIVQFPELQVVLVAFEATDDEAEQMRRVKGFKERKNVSFTTLIAGKLGTENVMEKFPMIGSFGGYPTTFLLDKSGDIVEIHTGFNGPATGILFDQFKEKQDKQIKEFLAEN